MDRERRDHPDCAIADGARVVSRLVSDDDRTRCLGVRHRSRPTRGRPGLILLGSGLALALVLGGASTAAIVSSDPASSSLDREDIRLGGPGKRLDPRSGDFVDVVRRQTKDIPFPSDQARRISSRVQVSEARQIRALISTSALRGFAADDAICAWANSWSAAIENGGDADARSAARQLDAASSWPAVSTLDEEMKERTSLVTLEDGQEHELSDNTRFSYLPEVQYAARSGSQDLMADVLMNHVRCIPALMPDLQGALPPAMRSR